MWVRRCLVWGRRRRMRKICGRGGLVGRLWILGRCLRLCGGLRKQQRWGVWLLSISHTWLGLLTRDSCGRLILPWATRFMSMWVGVIRRLFWWELVGGWVVLI